MKLTLIIFAALVCQAAKPAFAQTQSGFLVNSKCFESEELNANPRDSYVDLDKDLEVRLCSPNAKTKSFTLVDHDGMGFRLDSAGNAKAAELVRQTGKRNFLEVNVTGGMSKNEIDVNSISIAK